MFRVLPSSSVLRKQSLKQLSRSKQIRYIASTALRTISQPITQPSKQPSKQPIMPFFPRFHYPAETNAHYTAFPTDILRMFDEIDRATSSGSSTSSTSRRAFSPTFDVHETEHEYVLEGEFPGLSDKNNVSIEFTDDKTILISGKIEREFKGWKDEQGKLESAEEQKKIEGGQTTAGQEAEKSDKKVEKKEKLKSPKYWVSERSVGEFSRSFSFPGPVDIDQVKASLEHGILKIVVPKMEKRTGRKIEIC